MSRLFSKVVVGPKVKKIEDGAARHQGYVISLYHITNPNGTVLEGSQICHTTVAFEACR